MNKVGRNTSYSMIAFICSTPDLFLLFTYIHCTKINVAFSKLYIQHGIESLRHIFNIFVYGVTAYFLNNSLQLHD